MAVRTVGLLLLVLTAGAYLPTPLYPGYQRQFAYGDLVMTLLFATFALVSGPALVMFGSAADTWGHRRVLRLSLAPAAAGSLCFLFAQAPGWLFAGRVGQALALGAATGAAQALLARHRSPAARLGAPLLASLGFVGGTGLGPAVSGVLAAYSPGPTVTPYVLHLVLLGWLWRRLCRTVPEAAGGAPGAAAGDAHGDGGTRPGRHRWHPVRPRPGPGRPRPVRPHIPSGMRTVFLVAGVNGLLAWAAVGIHLALVPALLTRTLRTDDPALSGGVLGAVLGCSVLAQLAAMRRAVGAVQLCGIALLVAALAPVALTGALSLAATLASALLTGAGHGLVLSGATRAVDERTPASQRATVGAALYLLFYLGSAAPAVAVGLLSAWMPLTVSVTLLSWTGVAVGLSALPFTFCCIVRNGRRRPGAAVPPAPTGAPALSAPRAPWHMVPEHAADRASVRHWRLW